MNAANASATSSALKLTVKNYKSCRGNEGDAFSCTVYVNGKRAALVQYDGWGGGFMWDWTPADKCIDGGATSDKYDEHVLAYMRSQPDFKKGDDKKSFFLSCGRDIVLENAINDMLDEKQVKRWCNTKIVYRCVGDEQGAYRTWNHPRSKQYKKDVSVRKLVRSGLEKGLKGHGLKLEEILNDRFAA